MQTPKETAKNMLARYSSKAKAAEMALFHGLDYKEGSDNRKFWQEVQKAIEALSKE